MNTAGNIMCKRWGKLPNFRISLNMLPTIHFSYKVSPPLLPMMGCSFTPGKFQEEIDDGHWTPGRGGSVMVVANSSFLSGSTASGQEESFLTACSLPDKKQKI